MAGPHSVPGDRNPAKAAVLGQAKGQQQPGFWFDSTGDQN